MRDCLVLGAGVIGLSIARELARCGLNVSVLDRQLSGRIASWAAAGVLPPPGSAHDPQEQLRRLSHELYPRWAQQLEEESGVSIELESCGGIHIARGAGEVASLSASVADWRRDGIDVRPLTPNEFHKLEPLVESESSLPIRSTFLLPEEMRLRPPRLLRALRASLERLNVTVSGARVELVENHGTAIAMLDDRPVVASTIVVAAGPWSSELLKPLNINLGVEPYRGQMVMWNPGTRLIRHVINEGLRYLVARSDGRLLAGSTVEDVGFENETTREGIEGLVRFGQSILPCLEECKVEATWSGLRPRSLDGLPLIGRIGSIENVIVATGHFTSGVHLAPATAECVSQLVQSRPTCIDLTPFAPRRN